MSRLTNSFFNFKFLLICITIWLLFVGTLPSWLNQPIDQMNQTVFRIGLYFTQLPPPKAAVTIVHVPDLEYERWLVDLPGAKGLEAIIGQDRDDAEFLKRRSEMLVGIVLEQPIALIQPESESLLTEIQQGRTSSQHLYIETNEALARRAKLVEKLNAQSVVLGVYSQRSNQQRAVTMSMGELAYYPEFITDWLWPNNTPFLESVTTPALNYFPIFTQAYPTQENFLISKREEAFFPSFLLEFIRRSHVLLDETVYTDDRKDVQWHRDQGFLLSDLWLNASPSGSVIPIYGKLSGIQRPLRQISLSAALSKGDLSGWVLIGRDSSPVLYKTAQALASLGDQALMYSPFWVSPLQKLGFLALLLFFLFFIPNLSMRRGLFFVFFMASSLVTAQVISQVLYGFWVPCGVLMMFLLVGHLIIVLWSINSKHHRKIRTLADDANTQLAQLHLQSQSTSKDQLLKVFELLKTCRTTDLVLECLYDTYQKFESLAFPDMAFDVLRELRRRKRNYKDIGVKIKETKGRLVEVNKAPKTAIPGSTNTGTEPSSQLMPLDQTYALASPALGKTTFGRYEIEHELGRGASGTVYLGFDPLISRQVAIKTLNYHQFSEAEIDAVKARFVREAEAAGGLSHPNIVPVFDVGEEGGAAYIAMDFAKGSPLSDFITAETLLPPYDVYRIVLSIAEALEYAHNHKIVHRDIKPGNVLYCDEPYQVRITDFGIARFVDHSHTQTGEILGSPLYMAPEQLLGKKVSYSADIFSLGVMFYQLLTGVLPFSGDSLASLTYDIVHTKHKGARTLRKSLPASATRITNVALQKKDSDRYTSAEAMAEAIRKAIKRDFSGGSLR